MERVQKIIAASGFSSRRKAEEYIVKRQVKINGKIATLGDKATLDDQITINGKVINVSEDKVYFLLNKPSGYVTTVKDEHDRKKVLDLINEKQRLFPVGRLDFDTKGALLLTNDGALTHKLTHPSFGVKKVYRARINQPLTKEDLKFLNGPNVSISGKPSAQEVTKVDNKSYIIVLALGTFHHVKKLFELVEREVVALTRVEFAGITIQDLQVGHYRALTMKEVKWLKELVK